MLSGSKSDVPGLTRRETWRVTRIGASFVLILILLMVIGGLTALGVGIIVFFAGLVTWISLYNWRATAARSLLVGELGEQPRAAALGPRLPGRIWWGTNGALIAASGTAVAAATVTVRTPTLLMHADAKGCSAEVSPVSRFSTLLTVRWDGDEVGIRTAGPMAAEVREAVVSARSGLSPTSTA